MQSVCLVLFYFSFPPPATSSHSNTLTSTDHAEGHEGHKKELKIFHVSASFFFSLTRPRTHIYKCKCQNMRKSAAVSVTSQLVVDLFSLKNVVVEKRTRGHAVRILINIFEYLPLARSGLECGFLFLVSREEQFHRWVLSWNWHSWIAICTPWIADAVTSGYFRHKLYWLAVSSG